MVLSFRLRAVERRYPRGVIPATAAPHALDVANYRSGTRRPVRDPDRGSLAAFTAPHAAPGTVYVNLGDDWPEPATDRPGAQLHATPRA